MFQLVSRNVPVNLRQSGHASCEMLISTRVRKSPYWHRSIEAGARSFTVYNHTYHPRAFFPPECGGLLAEHEHLTHHVTLWDVAVERQIQIKGPDALEFTNLLVTRDLKRICPVNRARYVILCNEAGGIINDPVLLRIAEDEFWLSISDSDVLLWAQGLNYALGYDVTIRELDVAPLQIQGPKSQPLMQKLFGGLIDGLKYYWLTSVKWRGLDLVISRTGFSGEVGYEIYLHNATEHADQLWDDLLAAGEEFQLKVIAPSHVRRIEAGILSYGQDMDIETNPFEVNLDWQVDPSKERFIGKEALAQICEHGVRRKLVGLRMADSQPLYWYNTDFWTVCDALHSQQVGYISSAFYSPKLGCNIGLAMVPVEYAPIGTALTVQLPEETSPVDALVVGVPFVDPRKEIPSGRIASEPVVPPVSETPETTPGTAVT